MTIVRVKGFKIFHDRHGHLRCYHRKTGAPVDLKKTPVGSPGFIAECARIAALADAPVENRSGALGLLICDYRKSPLFRPWSDQERDAVLSAAPDHMRPAIGLMMFTGLGPKDALALPRNFVKGGEIATRRAKTGEPVFWPMPAPLADILATAPRHMATTLCANSKGRPWSLSGFSTSWRTLRLRLEKEGCIGPGLTPYGLRHTLAVILRETGCDERTIADALGQRTIEMARHYAKGADLKGKMRGVVKEFDAELARRKRGD